VNKALRGWRRKPCMTEERFNTEWDRFEAHMNNHAHMRRIHQLGVTKPHLIHNGRKPR
jgi:hypothetical protein